MSTEIIQLYSVNDDMPDDDETVLVFEPDSPSDKVWMGYHDGDEGWRYIDGRKTLFTVTHWATMLAGPKKPQPPAQTERQHADEKANLSAG
jgi:hypothetical protein